MTPQTPPTDRPLTAGDVPLLREGDVLRVVDYCSGGPVVGAEVEFHHATSCSIWLGQDEDSDNDGWAFNRFTFVSRPATSAANEGSVNSPDMPGAYEGDVFFGDPENTTKATHRWSGGQWTSLEASPAASVMNAHRGDPCIYCGVDHDDVPPGPCKGDRIVLSRAHCENLLSYLEKGAGPSGWPTTLWLEVQQFISDVKSALGSPALASPPVSERERELERALREARQNLIDCGDHFGAGRVADALTAQPQEPV